jgi:hypothetical protein
VTPGHAMASINIESLWETPGRGVLIMHGPSTVLCRWVPEWFEGRIAHLDGSVLVLRVIE